MALHWTLAFYILVVEVILCLTLSLPTPAFIKNLIRRGLSAVLDHPTAKPVVYVLALILSVAFLGALVEARKASLEHHGDVHDRSSQAQRNVVLLFFILVLFPVIRRQISLLGDIHRASSAPAAGQNSAEAARLQVTLATLTRKVDENRTLADQVSNKRREVERLRQLNDSLHAQASSSSTKKQD